MDLVEYVNRKLIQDRMSDTIEKSSITGYYCSESLNDYRDWTTAGGNVKKDHGDERAIDLTL